MTTGLMTTGFYVSVEGGKTGKFVGETPPGPHEGKIAGIGFSYGVATPRDGLAGQAAGRRTHQAVSFVKQWGATTPQFFQAVVSNDVLKSVLFEFVGVNDIGEEHVFQTVQLTNASLSALEQSTERDPDGSGNLRFLDKISLAFQKIEISNVDGGTTAIDDLKGNR